MTKLKLGSCLAAAIQLATDGSCLAAIPEISSYDLARKAGEQAFSNNSYGVAEKSFLQAQKEAEKFGPKDIRNADACKNLANLYEVRGQFPKAEIYLEKELRAREKALGSEHPKVVCAVGKLVRFYIAHGSAAKADKMSGLLVVFADRLIKQEDSLTAHFNELEKYFNGHPEYAEPAGKLKQCRELTHKVEADDHLEFAACLDAVATAYKEKGKFAAAEQMYKKSIVLRERTLPPGHLALAFGYEGLANLYVAQGKTELAQPLFRQALEVTGKTLDLKRPEVYSRLDGLAKSYISLGQEASAEQLYKQALTLFKENNGAGHRDVGSASYALGMLYLKQGRSGEAEPLFKTAVKIGEAINGPQSASMISLLDAYALALEKNNHSGEAAKIRARSNSIKGVSTACNSQDF